MRGIRSSLFRILVVQDFQKFSKSLKPLCRPLLSAGVPEWSANALVDLQRLYREGRASMIDPAVEQLLGRKATPFDDFAKDYRFAFRQDTRAAS
jgi:hypothetical protein